MKNKLISCLLLLSPFFLTAQNTDTTIKGVYVGFSFSSSIFPESWLMAPISAYGEGITKGEIVRSKKIITRALEKYPEPVIAGNLAGVYFLSRMKFFDVPFAGTNSADAVYLVNQGIVSGFTDKYLEQTFHHEFSSILFRKYPSFIDTNQWKMANAPGFIYNDPYNGVGAIRNNQTSQDLDSLSCRKGILTQYAGSSIENDVNTFAQNLFYPEKDFWPYVDRFPRIRKKVNLLIEFYNKISSMYSETYFRRLDRQ